MSKQTKYYCDLCKCLIELDNGGYGKNVFMSFRHGSSFVDREESSESEASVHICKECVEKILEFVFNSKPDKNSFKKHCPECGGKVVCGYNVDFKEHRYYCSACHGNFTIEDIENGK